MAIERFTKEQFEEALPDGFDLISTDSEYVYARPVDGTNKRIVVRSSVSPLTDLADECGRDSIRIWVEYRYNNTWYSLGKDDIRWTARTKNWRTNMLKRLRDAWKLAVADSKRRKSATTKEKAKEPKVNDNSDLNAFAAAAVSDATETVSAIPSCPKCGAEMRERTRRSDGAKFYGCSTFPRCKGTRDASAVGGTAQQIKTVEKKEYPPSPLQQKIYDFVANGTGHGVVAAGAGTGKTTTNVGAIQHIDKSLKVVAIAFNKHIAKELTARVPDNATATTCHSLGFSNVRNQYPQIRFDGQKAWRHFKDYTKQLRSDTEFIAVDENAGPIVRLVSLCKGTLQAPTHENLAEIADHFGINFILDNAWSLTYIFDAVAALHRSTTADVSAVDYDDMIYFPAAGLVPCEKFDYVIVDECQDLNQAQIKLAFNSLKAGGRILATGDEFQSMYGFRGADADAVPNIIAAMTDDAGQAPTILPLSVTYRCPTTVVEMVNARFPEIAFEAAPNAKTGTIQSVPMSFLLDNVKTDDLILCRINAPLVSVCYSLIRSGKKATIRGRDIGKGLIDLIEKVQKRTSVYDLNALLSELAEYEANEVSKLIAAKKFSRAAMIEDQVETIVAVSDGCFSIQDVKTRIGEIFTDDQIGVVLSSVHRAKGDEANSVYILEPGLMPHPLAEQDWELVQERNIEYVALTRTKDRLFFVD